MPRYKSDERDDGGGNDNPHASSTKRSHQTTDAVRTKHRDRKIDEDVGTGRGTERSKRRHVLEQQRINHAVDTARDVEGEDQAARIPAGRARARRSARTAQAPLRRVPGTNTVRPLRSATATRPIVAVSIAARAILAIIDLIGVNRAEVVRPWIFLACFFQTPPRTSARGCRAAERWGWSSRHLARGDARHGDDWLHSAWRRTERFTLLDRRMTRTQGRSLYAN